MQGDRWVIRPFNGVFFGAFAAVMLLLVVASCFLRKKDERVRRGVIVGASLLTLIGFFVYKACLSADAEFDALTASMGGFNWWGELPLQLCNINMLLIPIAVLWKKRPLLSFCFFVGPLGALMALLVPGNGFSGYSLLLPRMLGYYGTHFAVIAEGLALGTFGLYKPKFRDLIPTVLTLFGVTVVIFGFDMLLRATGLHPKANYFFAVETEGNALLELFYQWLPVPCLYLILPGSAILMAYMLTVMLVITAVDKLKELGVRFSTTTPNS